MNLNRTIHKFDGVMSNVLIIFNPVVALWNVFKYFSHLQASHGTKYSPYDFEANDTKFFQRIRP